MRRALSLVVLFALGIAPAARAQDLVVRHWLVRGPFKADTSPAGVSADYLGGEASVLPDSGESVAGGSFIPVTADSDGTVDLNAVYAGRSTNWQAAYAHAYVHAPAERTVLLTLASDDDIAAFVNGQRVWLHVVARGVATARDTVPVRLAKGWNTILLEIRNRTGGFGFFGALAPYAAGGGVGDLALSADRPAGMRAHMYPAPRVAVGAIALDSMLVWTDGRLEAGATAPVTAWGRDTLHGVHVVVGPARAPWAADTLAALAPGEPLLLTLHTTFARLRGASLGTARVTATARWRGGRHGTALVVEADRLLRLAGGRVALGSLGVDSASGRPTRLHARLTVPAAFAGLTLDLLGNGTGPHAHYTVNGREVPWRDGRVPLCAPCTEGATLDLAVALDPTRPLWLMPQTRVRDPGYAEFADGYRYARALADTVPPIAPPDAAAWLRALGTPAYGALLGRYRAAYAPLATAIKQDTLFLTGNSHIDAAWLWRWRETIDVIRHTWGSALKLSYIFPGYVFAASSAAYFDAMQRLYPAFEDSLRQATADGRWAPVGGWWVEADQNIPSGESLVRQGLYGQRYFQRQFGHRSKVAWTPDTFGYMWTIPQILKLEEFDYFVTQKVRWNDSTKFPYDAFYWEGRDGTTIFTYIPYGYDHDLSPGKLVPQRIEDRSKTYGGHDQLVLYGVGDHGGGPTIGMLHRAENLRRVPTFPVMQDATPFHALRHIEHEATTQPFPVWNDELYLEYHRGTYTSHAMMKRRNRRSEAMLQTAEALATVDTAAYPRDRLEGAWRRVLFNQFHDLLPGSGIDSIYMDAAKTYDTAWAMIDTVTHTAFADLRARMDTKGKHAVVVFNALGWTRSGRVAVPDGGDTTWITVDSVPALGAIVVHLPHDSMSADERALPAPTAGPNWIENAFLRVEIDTTTGEITRLYDKTAGREALAPGGRGNVLQVHTDEPQEWDAWNIGTTGPVYEVTDVRHVATHADSRAASIDLTRHWGASTFHQVLALRRAERYLDVANDVDWHERQKLLKVAFTLGVTADSATYEIPYGTIGRSGNPQTKRERAKFEVPGQRWADVSEPDFGVTILDDSKYGWDYHGDVLRLSLLKAPIWPDSTADRGMQHFRFAVLPHTGDWRSVASDRRGAEYNVPLLAARAPSHGGSLGRSVSFAAASPGDVQLAWIKRDEDHTRTWVLRLVEWHGVSTTARVTLACTPTSIRHANLLEDPGALIIPDGRGFNLPLRPYEIATVLVECAR